MLGMTCHLESLANRFPRGGTYELNSTFLIRHRNAIPLWGYCYFLYFLTKGTTFNSVVAALHTRNVASLAL